MMANRGPSFDKHVFCIKDLEAAASKKMSKMNREYFNEGAMDLLTYFLKLSLTPSLLGSI
jgi:hypothetical protein